MKSSKAKKTASFVARILDGDVRADSLASEIRNWQEGDQKHPLHEALGLDAQELLLVAQNQDALRYLLHAKRFGLPRPQAAHFSTQNRVEAYAMQLASKNIDLHLLAEIEEWCAKSGSKPSEKAACHA